MPTFKQFSFASVLVCSLLSTAIAQDSPSAQRSSLTITASAAGERVRITAPSSVVQMHVEVYAASGEKLFDQEIRGGNVFDWHLHDGQAQRLAPGEYVCVVTAKSINGRLTQKIGTVSVAEKSVSVQPAESPKLSVLQTQAIGPVEENSSWTIAAQDEPQTGTVIANDGTDGQMIRGRGALTFRIGNFFSGIDQEQMRLTETGNLGIGTSEPKATLEVAGTIRAERFLIVRPRLAGVDKLSTDTLAADAVDVQPLVAGTGTQNQIAKWTDNAGTLGNSGITETAGGFVGIGTTSPAFQLHEKTPAGGVAFFMETVPGVDVFESMGTDPIAGPAFNFGYSGGTFGRGSGFFNARPDAGAVAPNPSLRFMTANIQRMIITNTGNVGIGTTSPAARLHVAGASSAAGSPVAIVESSGTQMPLSFRSGATENARIRANSFGNLFFATLNGSDKDIFFRAGDDTFTDMFIQSSTGNVGINTTSPTEKLEVSDGFVLSSGSSGGRFIANNPNNQSARLLLDWSNDTPRIRFGGSGVGANNGFVIQGPGDATMLKVFDSGIVSIGTPGDTAANLSVFGKIFLLDVGTAGSGGQLCYNTTPGSSFNAISFCSSSLRYKTDVRSFTPGLDLLNRLRPVSFRWKGSGSADLGLVAEEVERVDPLLVTYNKKGEVEGVKYDRLGVVLVNAIKEQQAQIKVQQQQLRAKDERIANLAARLARYESSLFRYEARLASLERSVARSKRTKRQVTVRANSTRQRGLRRATPSKAD